MKLMKSMLLLLPAVFVVLTGCRHKELCEDHTHALEIEVVFDWRNAPDADPTSMADCFYNIEDPYNPIRHDFVGRNGGKIIISPGYYSALGFNSNVTDWARFIGTDNIETFAVITRDVQELSAFGLDPGIVNKVRSSEYERVALTPEMFWCDRQNDIDLQKTYGKHVVTFYPEDPICYYTVTVLDIENFEYLKGSAVLDATLSGMAEGYMLGKRTTTDTRVTFPFELRIPDGTNTLYSEFLTFGECPGSPYKHELTIYVVFEDGSANSYTFDVTDQVRNAPDPRHVDIVIRGLVIPKPIANGGLIPEVEDWVSHYINLFMPLE